jgi:CPA1 family monovalent cation:H+ antiporter
VPSLEVVLGLMVAVTALALLARRAHVPYPVVLVLGGLVLAVIPGLPAVKLAPDLVFLIFLPPLITAAGWYTSVRDLKANRRAIGLLSIGLVIFTTLGVAAAAHTLVPGLGWGPAFVLGAIVSPTDAIAATAIMERSGAPHRIVAILEGESLLNDATGLVAFRYALMAVTTGTFIWWAAGLQFLWSVAAGIAIGLAVGWTLIQVWRRIDDPLLGIIMSLLVPYGTYLLADQPLHASGVLAVAVSGIYAGRRSSEVISPAARIQAVAVWDLLVFVLNGLAFILIGLQLRQVVAGLGGESPWRLAVSGLVVSLAVIVVRFVWVFAATYLPRLPKRVRERDPFPGWRNVVVVGWTGMRGVVSLAAALSVPLATNGGRPFPGRDLILFLTFSVILVTLLVQGLTLPVLLRRLGVTADGSDVHEEAQARFRAVDAAIGRLDELDGENGLNEGVATYVRAYYQKRRHTLSTRFGKLDHDHAGEGDGAETVMGHVHADGSDHLEEHRARAESMQRLRQELISVERTTVIGLRDQGVINDAALRRVERDLDLEEIRLIDS